MEWFKANKWIAIGIVVVVFVILGWGDTSFLPTDK